MIGQTISHYKILEKLGEGGMGIVYKAQDTKLDRTVALKFLSHNRVAQEAEQARFLQEARTASALNHPNVCTIYDIKEENNLQFIVMELVDGMTIKHKLPIQKLQDALTYALQIGDALHEAHSKGIIHRDIKCENIMVNSKNQVKVMDFGLAKLKGSLKLTKTSSTVGTLAYMAPEQLQGGESDPRTDIFSYGVVLFEIVTGYLPFRGEHEAALMYSIVYEEPASVTKFGQNLPPELDRIIHRALEKNPADRYQHVDDLVSELRKLQKVIAINVAPGQTKPVSTTEVTHVPEELPKHSNMKFWISAAFLVVFAVSAWLFILNKSGQEITSIAVLPFQYRSSDADAEYLSDGLSESLIYRLSRLPNLKVSPTSSVFRYKGKETDPITIGVELGVSAVMSGRIVRRDDNLTISVEIVNIQNRNLLWGEQYDRKLTDLLATHREIAAEIAQKLKLKLSGEERHGLTKNYTENDEAYLLYLKGRFHFGKRTKDDIQRGIDYFQQSIMLDPSFALAYVGIAESYAVMPSFPFMSPKEAMPHAKSAIAKALMLDPELPEAHTVTAVIASVYDWNWVEAEREFKRALELEPNLAITHYRYAWVYLSPMGHHDEAIVEMKRAMELEPLSLVQGANFAAVYIYARRYDNALEQAKATYDLDPRFGTAQSWVGHAYNAKGMYKESILFLTEQSSPFLAPLAYAYAKTGRRHEAETVLKTWKELEKTSYVSNYWVAITYAALGDKDGAFAELEKSYQQRDWFLSRLATDPYLDSLREDPRFAMLVKKIGLRK